MATAYEKLVRHFADRELRYSAHDERLTVTADFRGEVGSFRLMARIDEDDSLLQVFAYIPIRATPGSRAVIAEAVSRANFGMKVGKFELDMSDGELLYQAAQILVPGEDGETFLPDRVIGRLIGTALAMVDKYTPAYLSIIYGNETPEDAVRCVESPATPASDDPLRELLGGSSSDSSASDSDSADDDGGEDDELRSETSSDAGDGSADSSARSSRDGVNGDEDSDDELDDESDDELKDLASDSFEPSKDWSPDRDRDES